ncbi:hypothetical protein [uncultured Stenotrophomonas sp.]|uniref:hypothetical protein n=1 Tax=uncultured Stenotrophomonas sp. TaxID=165438 RepID=UPI0025EDAA7C|nr:hypothetical protein [uncultured Stenotrophomonas sp.]
MDLLSNIVIFILVFLISLRQKALAARAAALGQPPITAMLTAAVEADFLLLFFINEISFLILFGFFSLWINLTANFNQVGFSFIFAARA